MDAHLAIAEIRNHPEYQAIAKTYSPDLTLGDAATALTYLEWELENPPSINVAKLEAFLE
ncbi:hypothetical protein [Nostoc sp. FACHB-190]|uniref:hypothetical protein n=1 Tax=Nostoc sp. FACHB-190 TaxID=2692838 RepID=UPI0028C3CCD3|nr:hypothetical protein [Nostoc sp. FACHB-190]